MVLVAVWGPRGVREFGGGGPGAVVESALARGHGGRSQHAWRRFPRMRFGVLFEGPEEVCVCVPCLRRAAWCGLGLSDVAIQVAPCASKRNDSPGRFLHVRF